MQEDDIKKIWNRIDEHREQRDYSVDEIAAFRKARSKDFSAWIRSSLALDIALKSLVLAILVVLIVILRHQPGPALVGIGIVVLLGLLIPYEISIRKTVMKIDLQDSTIKESLIAKITFLKKIFYPIQIIQNLTYPFIVVAGLMIYYLIREGFIPPFVLHNWLISGALIILSFLLILPVNLSVYGFQLRNLQGCLNALAGPDEMEIEADRYSQRQKVLSILLYSILAIGIILLIVVMLL
ncbi:MAG: hypothetical protein V2A67_06565 [Bacteroidota bacterium]